MKLPRSIRLPLVTLCGTNSFAMIAGFVRDWPLALLGAFAWTVALCWLVRAAYAQGHVDGLLPRRPQCTNADVARYARRLRRS